MNPSEQQEPGRNSTCEGLKLRICNIQNCC